MRKRKEPKLVCPDCGTDQVVVVAEQSFMVNTGEHYCHSMKTQDSDATSRCLECGWAGQRQNLKVQQCSD
jgi:predicted RNA-binding Zn-ribbon protein involved in translation (DUF1610 family)